MTKRWKTWLELDEHLSLNTFKRTRSNSSQVGGQTVPTWLELDEHLSFIKSSQLDPTQAKWVAKRYPTWTKLKTWLELDEHLSLIKSSQLDPTRAKWVAKRYPTWTKLKPWLELAWVGGTVWPTPRKYAYLTSPISRLVLQLTDSEKAPSVIQACMEKHGIENEDPHGYELVQVLPGKGWTGVFCILLFTVLIGSSISLFNSFTPKSDQLQISPVISPKILHHPEWRIWFFIAHSHERWLYDIFSLPHLYITLR